MSDGYIIIIKAYYYAAFNAPCAGHVMSMTNRRRKRICNAFCFHIGLQIIPGSGNIVFDSTPTPFKSY